MGRYFTASAALAAAFVWSTTGAFALEVGDKAPGFSKLPGVDGKHYSLDTYKNKKALVLVFTCNECPVSKAYESRLVQLAKDYGSKGVAVVAINSNDPNRVPGDSFEHMKTRAKEKGFTFPYVFDATQAVAKSYGAKVTPHVFVVKGGKVAYVGAIDDTQDDPKNVKTPYLRDALDALLSGKQPAKAHTRAFGCGIKWKST